jgi:hypothetical protein
MRDLQRLPVTPFVSAQPETQISLYSLSEKDTMLASRREDYSGAYGLSYFETIHPGVVSWIRRIS